MASADTISAPSSYPHSGGTFDLPLAARTSRRVTAICWFGLFSEGYDVGVFGAVLPAMMADPQWHLSPAVAGLMASAVLVGMFFGGFLFGGIADRIGRKPTFLACLCLFSTFSGLAALAPTPVLFALCRFVAGIGVGGIVPVCAALTSEYALPGKGNRQFGLMYTGYSLGIFASALISSLLVARFGWRAMIGIGVIPAMLAPVIAALLPESVAFLASKGRTGPAAALAQRLGVYVPVPPEKADNLASWREAMARIFSAELAPATFGFILANFAGMILVYGLNTWLPQIMRTAGYDLGPSIMFLGVFALFSAAGGVWLGWIADRLGLPRTIAGAFALGAVAIIALAVKWPLPITYAVVAFAGIGSVSAAVIVSSYAANYYPSSVRASAVGCFISVSRFGAVCGPMIGAMIGQYGLNFIWNFVAFAIAAILGAAAIFVVPSREG
ncbi:MAG: MFS transporter [Novosphingobium sp.]